MVDVKYCNFHGYPIRYFELDGNLWFVVQDFDGILARAVRNMVYKHLKKGKEFIKISTSDFSRPNVRKQNVQISGRLHTKCANTLDTCTQCTQNVQIKNHSRLVVSEKGLYKLMTLMHSPIAKEFKDFVANMVLSIRNGECYQAEQEEKAFTEKKEKPIVVERIGNRLRVEIPICEQTTEMLREVYRLFGL